jgi:hypothetical protein
MGGVFCNCFEYPRRTFCVEYHTLYPTEIDVYLNHYTLHDATRRESHSIIAVLVPAHVDTRPYAATETAGPGGEARCGDEPRTGPPSWRGRPGAGSGIAGGVRRSV